MFSWFRPFNQKKTRTLSKSKEERLHASSRVFSAAEPEKEALTIDTERIRREEKWFFTFFCTKDVSGRVKHFRSNGISPTRRDPFVHYRSMKNLKWITWWFKTLFDFVVRLSDNSVSSRWSSEAVAVHLSLIEDIKLYPCQNLDGIFCFLSRVCWLLKKPSNF